MFPSISPKQSFPALESEVLAYWKANNTFQKSIDSRPEDNPYRFYDGPPFITGTPHYGSLLSSIVKDVVGRYWTMRGKRVDRVWGWDCHGLPIEEKVQKKLGLKSNKEIEERGVKEFIDGCYEYTQSTSAEWDWYIDKIGRWVDMDRAYRTMDQDYMESVMWVFSQLWNKGLIYEGKRVSLYSWKLSTPISNFEVAMDDTYQDVNDPAITVKFDLSTNGTKWENTYILAWTTTPWTIPANMALAVGENIDYVLVENNNEQYIIAKNRIESIFKGKGEYTIIREFSGSELVGLEYLPPFPEYYHGKTGDKSHKVYSADFATDTDGTGIVHIAPEFGDVDFGLAKKEGIPVTEALDNAGKYTSEIFDYEGTHYLDLENPEKGANKINIERMKANGTLFKNEGITHRVPFCPRSGTPLVQKAQASWFIDIASQKEKLLAANEKINWFPEYLKHGRFAKGIESAPDWCISRTRYWGAPMPVWQNQDGSERVVVASREEIFEMNKPYGQLTKIIFVRHREATCNTEDVCDYSNVCDLTEKGRADAIKLKDILKNTTIDYIYSSPFDRCMHTMEPLAQEKGIKIIQEKWIEEINTGHLDGQKSSIHEGIWDHWNDVKIGETGESHIDCYNRVSEFLQKVAKNHAGKTVVICSHGDPIFHMRQYLHNFDYEDKKVRTANYPSRENYDVDYIFSDSCTPLNLHRPYIDSIFLAPQNAKKAKKILGVHGFKRTDAVIDFLEWTKKNLEKEGIEMDAPMFECGEKIDYQNWEKKFDALDVASYDTILTHSMGSRATIEYIIEHKIALDRLIMVSPALSSNRPEIIGFYSTMKHDISEVQKYVKEIIVLHSKNDTIHTLEQSKEFSETVGGKLIVVDGFGHFNLREVPLIENIIHWNQVKKVLGIHGRWSDIQKESWKERKEVFEKNGISLDLFQFDKSEDPTFESWKQVFDDINFSEYDAIYTSSLGGVMTVRYLAEKWIKVPRIVMVAPWISHSVASGTKPNIQSIYNSLSSYDIKNISSEIIVLHAKDDDTVPFENGKDFAEKLWATFIPRETGNHLFRWQYQLINGLIQCWTPLKRIPEVLDVWMDSGSMPYAQMHYPFENKGEMEASFPADFIAEYVGQVRAWFYVMHVLGVLLDIKNDSTISHPEKGESEGVTQKGIPQDETPPNHPLSGEGPKPAFLNVITTGVINGNDGRKMSKSFGNYPDPKGTIEKYGADPIRFYMLNSPLLSGGDMDFKEEGIIETIKSVMLPIWNTYSFFTTYANIDAWEKDETEVWFSRHAETTSNLAGRMSDGTDNPDLTEKGIEQAKEAGKKLREQGKNFDIVIHTGLTRARHTAELIATEIGFSGEYMADERFTEQAAGEYAGVLHDDMRKQYAESHGISEASVTNHHIRTLYKNNSTEGIEAFESRILEAYADILEKYHGKKILIVAHAGTSRPILHHYFGKTLENAHYHTTIGNADPYRLMTTSITNPLDRWILSRLQVLIAQVHDAMDGYDVSRACRSIVEYMDELTNWYVRLSRRRFWGSEMTADKKSGYETLHTVLLEVSKLLAPYMPFLSESIYKGLTDKDISVIARNEAIQENNNDSSITGSPRSARDDTGDENSVHLQYVTFPNRHLIDTGLNRDMEIAEHIVSLGLALRSRKNIRVRQPLQSITITRELDEYYQSIIRDELNVKEVRYENPEKLAKKICKPDARKIGPKYGKEVQFIIKQGKEGNFIEWEDWKIVIARNEAIQGSETTGSPLITHDDGNNFILETGEYTIEYLPLEGVGDVEGGYGMVISMDMTITEILALEGYARDIIRAIQDMRKEADYQVTDRISLHIYGEHHDVILEHFWVMIQSETLSTLGTLMINPDLEKSIELEVGNNITIQIEK